LKQAIAICFAPKHRKVFLAGVMIQ